LERTDDNASNCIFIFNPYIPIYFDVCFSAEAFEILGREVLEKWMCEVSGIHICQCPFAILWQGYGKVFVCCILKKVTNIENDWPFSLV
jgi:hypothetical protein